MPKYPNEIFFSNEIISLHPIQIGYLKSQKGSIGDNFSKMFTDNFIERCNWSGTNNKVALKTRVFINTILFGKLN